MYASVNQVSIGLDNGVLPIQCQAIILTNAVNRILRNKIRWKFYQNTKLLINQSALEIIICEMVAIFPGKMS